MSDEITQLIKAIKEGEAQTRSEMQEMRGSIQTMADNFSQYWQHMAVYEEDKKHDDAFKKEVREHIKDARPLLDYVKDQKTVTGKMKVAFYIAVMFAILAGLGFSLK